MSNPVLCPRRVGFIHRVWFGSLEVPPKAALSLCTSCYVTVAPMAAVAHHHPGDDDERKKEKKLRTESAVSHDHI